MCSHRYVRFDFKLEELLCITCGEVVPTNVQRDGNTYTVEIIKEEVYPAADIKWRLSSDSKEKNAEENA